MSKLSVVIITFNEERNIERCLASVQSIADEIVVLDSFSTDKTEAICKQYEVVYSAHKFDGHIQQKNRAMQMASFDWVLSLDADEALDATLRQEILRVKGNPMADGYKFNRMTNYCGKWIKHSGWYPDVKLRLWNRTKGNWGGDNPHDKVIMEDGSSIVHLKGNIHHYSYYSINEHHKQNDYFSTIGAQELFKKGKKSSIFKASYKGIWMFVRNYIFKLGFLDGKYGFIVCKLTASGTYAKYWKLMSLHKHNKNH